MQRISAMAKRLLDEHHWSFRDQEPHTRVSANTVYQLTVEQTVPTTDLLKLAVAAKYLAMDEPEERFWRILESRLRTVDFPCFLTPEMQDDLCQWVDDTMQENDQAVANASAALQTSVSLEQEAHEIMSLYEGLAQQENRQAVRQLLEALRRVEGTCQGASPEPSKNACWWSRQNLTAPLT